VQTAPEACKLAKAKKARNLLVLSHGLQHIASTALPPLLLFIAADVGLSGTELGFIIAAGAVTSGVFQVPAGWLADKFTARHLLIAGYCLTLGGLLMLSRSETFYAFIAAQALYGMGNSTFHPASFADVGRTAGLSGGLAMNMAMHNVGGNLGTAAGYSVSALLAALLGWRNAVLALVFAGAVLVMLFYLNYPNLAELDPDSDKRNRSGDLPPVEKEVETIEPELPPARKWTPIMIIAVGAMFSGIFDAGLMNWLPAFFAETRGASETAAALFATIVMASGAGGSLAGGSLGDRFHRGKLVFFSTACTALLLVAMVLLPVEGIILTAVVMSMGFFYSLARPSLSAITTEASPRGRTATSFGITFGVMAMGGSLAGPVVGYIWDVASLNLAFLLLAAVWVCYGLTIAGVTRWFDLSGQGGKMKRAQARTP